ADDENSWNQAWHLPTAAEPLTGAGFIGLAAKEFERPPHYQGLPKGKIVLAGLFNKDIASLYEMLYQYEFDYHFDSSKFEKAYAFRPTSYGEGIKATANAYRNG